LDIKDDKFNIGEIFVDDGAIKAAYWERVNLKEVIIEVETSGFFFGRVVANENRGLQNLRKSQFWQFAAICSNLLQNT